MFDDIDVKQCLSRCVAARNEGNSLPIKTSAARDPSVGWRRPRLEFYERCTRGLPEICNAKSPTSKAASASGLDYAYVPHTPGNKRRCKVPKIQWCPWWLGKEACEEKRSTTPWQRSRLSGGEKQNIDRGINKSVRVLVSNMDQTISNPSLSTSWFKLIIPILAATNADRSIHLGVKYLVLY